jgi:hypothetical protein
MLQEYKQSDASKIQVRTSVVCLCESCLSPFSLFVQIMKKAAAPGFIGVTASVDTVSLPVVQPIIG